MLEQEIVASTSLVGRHVDIFEEVDFVGILPLRIHRLWILECGLRTCRLRNGKSNGRAALRALSGDRLVLGTLIYCSRMTSHRLWAADFSGFWGWVVICLLLCLRIGGKELGLGSFKY